MIAHEYSPREALDLLLQRAESGDHHLAEQMRLAIDAGKDVEEEGPLIGSRKKSRRYRKAVPFTDEEALKVVLDVLQAYFVEQPLFVTSALDNFRAAGVGDQNSERSSPKSGGSARGTAVTSVDTEKELEVEAHAETQISRPSDEMLPLIRIDAVSVEQQERNLEALRSLIDFNGAG